MMEINRNRLPAKYAMEVYKMVDGYPSTIDILYELVNVLEERKALETPFQASSLLKEIVSREPDMDLVDSLDSLAKQGYLQKSGDHFTLVKHPWQKLNP
jgi:hypothetical protein